MKIIINIIADQKDEKSLQEELIIEESIPQEEENLLQIVPYQHFQIRDTIVMPRRN